MTSWTLARRSLRFYLRSHLGTIAGAAIATAVLTGALLVGDSVRSSLRRMALDRLGQVDSALISGDRLFSQDLPGRMAPLLQEARLVSVFQLLGTAASPDGSARANQVQITGVDDGFWALANEPITGTISNNTVWVNARLASHLRVNPGDTVLLRIPRVSHLSRDAPLSPEEDTTAALRLEVGRILSEAEFGRFGMQASQVPPFNAFLPLELLQSRANATNQANLLLAAPAPGSASPLELERLETALARNFRSEDAQLQWRFAAATNSVELRSPRVFLDESIARAATTADSTPVFTYFVNQLRRSGQSTPYSMVSATTEPYLPEGMGDDEMLINAWLAEDLGAKPGDEITITYYVMGLMRELVEQTNTFRVRAVVPMEMPHADPTLMPDFPGMTDADNCRDWDTGFPIDTEAIRDKDEAYWDQYRGTPKAFITLAAGQRMWSNRFGSLTAVRYPVQGSPAEALLARKTSFEQEHLDPAMLGFTFLPVREQALAASRGAQDFGGLFIGFSFFLIAAALMLMVLLFRFALEQRGEEVGTLLALGFEPKKIRRLLIFEAAGLAVLGGILGVAGGILYARAMIYGLSTIWREAVAAAALDYYASPATLATGFFAGLLVAILTMWWSLRREGQRSARELLAEGMEAGVEPEPGSGPAPLRSRFRRNLVIGAVSLVLAAATVGTSLLIETNNRSQLFFLAGALLLVAGLAFSSALIRKLELSALATRLSLTGMGVRSITRRGTRSRATIMLLACGAFLIASIGAFRLDSGTENQRSSGTGGFALIAQSAIPVVHNLNADSGREFFALRERDLEGVSFLPLRVLEGEDASCLNLNRAQRPRLLGVNPQLLHQRGAFTFSKVLKGQPSEDPWLLLEKDFGPGIVPAIGDAASIQWALGKSIGDELLYLDHHGQEFRVKIVAAVANSILQGSLLIPEQAFVRRFPTEAGYRMFLIDAPSNRAEEVATTLSRALQDAGLEVGSAAGRLAEFNAVQNTYLGTFQLLGGLGLLLGSFGLGIVLLRNVFERRGEFALLLAVGFRKRALKWLVLSEHAALLLLGLAVGVAAAAIAVLPALITPGAQLPSAHLVLTLGAVFVCGLLFTVAAASFALRAPLLNALRNE